MEQTVDELSNPRVTELCKNIVMGKVHPMEIREYC